MDGSEDDLMWEEPNVQPAAEGDNKSGSEEEEPTYAKDEAE